jgi:phospholipid-binding lipoprotein MlaA
MTRWKRGKQIKGHVKWLLLPLFYGILWGQLHGTVLGETQEGFSENGEASYENASGKAAIDPHDPDLDLEDPFAQELPPTVPDPLEPFNRAMFTFNDRLYFWALKPVAKGYRAIAPKTVRVGVRNFFLNLTAIIPIVNCFLQGKLDSGGEELGRFFVNTIFGIGGFMDIASDIGYTPHDEELGQTFGVWGIGPGFYLTLPFLGPSTLRDFGGWFGDLYINPLNEYLPLEVNLSLRAYHMVNDASLRIGDYEDLKAAALDPYVALRDAYYQNRLKKINE